MTDSKDIVFEEPRVLNKYAREDAEDKTSPRGYWTVAEVEECLWRVRASGGTDSTSIKFERGARSGMAIRATGIEVFDLLDTTVAPPRRPAGDDPRAGHEIPPLLHSDLDLPRVLLRSAQAAGVLLAVPLVGILLVLVWRLFLGIAT